ncbi:rhomboid family intramembrane serine protease [Paracoccus cavernae]
MRSGFEESPLNPVPAIVWILALPMIAVEAVFGLGQLGFMNGGGGGGIGMRQIAVEKTAYVPEMLLRMWSTGTVFPEQLARLLTYSFVNVSLVNAVFVIVFTLALGNMVANQFRALSVVVLFFGSAIGGALVYTLFAGIFPQVRFQPLMGVSRGLWSGRCLHLPALDPARPAECEPHACLQPDRHAFAVPAGLRHHLPKREHDLDRRARGLCHGLFAVLRSGAGRHPSSDGPAAPALRGRRERE